MTAPEIRDIKTVVVGSKFLPWGCSGSMRSLEAIAPAVWVWELKWGLRNDVTGWSFCGISPAKVVLVTSGSQNSFLFWPWTVHMRHRLQKALRHAQTVFWANYACVVTYDQIKTDKLYKSDVIENLWRKFSWQISISPLGVDLKQTYKNVVCKRKCAGVVVVVAAAALVVFAILVF